MGHFADLLLKAAAEPVDDDPVLSEFEPGSKSASVGILTRDALAAVSLDEAGVDFAPGDITVLVCEDGAVEPLSRPVHLVFRV